MAKKPKKTQDKEIKIACRGARALPFDVLVETQGNLKSLSNADYQRLKGLILKHGFSDPIGVWPHGGKENVLSGHQRLRTIRRMVIDEGYRCPALPVNDIDADTLDQAKEKILAMAAQFGKIEKDGLYEFLQGMEMQPEELVENFRFPDLDIPAFTEEFYVDNAGNDVNDIANANRQDLEGQGQPPAPVPTPTPHQVAAGSGVGTSHVQMVQLFFTAEQRKTFNDWAAAAAARLGSHNITDTVYKVFEEAAGRA